MTAVALSLLSQFWPVIVAVIGALGWGLHQRRAGAAKERAKQDRADRKALDERLEMHREATDFERQAAGMSDEELDRRLRR